MKNSHQEFFDYDVVILGGSISATTLSLCLASQGLNVALIDQGVHPRFALGESLLKPTAYWMRLLALRFNVPALDVLSNVDKISTSISNNSGVKKNFGFVKHHKKSDYVSDQWWSNIPISYNENISEAHLFRQDSDAYLFHTAVKQCKKVYSGYQIESLEVNDKEAIVKVAGESLKARYLVDCGGARSLLAEKYQLRDEVCKFKSRSRTIFTHMTGVVPFDQCAVAPQAAIDWHEGTLHHILDGAWVWVIPFDNRTGSTNSLVSIGVTFDCNHFPEVDESGEQQWNNLLESYPILKKQFSGAKPVRPWVSSGTLQYSSKQACGERYFLLSQAYGGIDALYSRGLLNTMQSIYLLSNTLIKACSINHFENDEFKKVEFLQQQALEINDLLTTGSYLAFDDSCLTTWWLSIWTFIEKQSIAHVQPALTTMINNLTGITNNQTQSIILVDKTYADGLSISNQQTVLTFLRSAVEVMELLPSGKVSKQQVKDNLLLLSKPLQLIGFDFFSYTRLLKKAGFDPLSRIILQLEHEFVELLNKVEDKLNLTVSLKNQCSIKLLIRFLTQCLIADARKFKNQDRDCFDNEINNLGRLANFLVELDGEQLFTQLTQSLNKMSLAVEQKNALKKQLPMFHNIYYQEISHQHRGKVKPFDPLTEHHQCLLNFSDGDSSLSLYKVQFNSDLVELKIYSRDNLMQRNFSCKMDKILLMDL